MGCATTNTSRKVFPNAPSTTSNAESLVRETNDPSQEYYPSVSPDGKFLLYNAIETSSSVSFSNGSLVTKTDKRSIIIKKEIGKPTKSPLLQNASDPTWMPSGGGIMCSYTKPTKPVIIRTNAEGVGLNYV